MNRSLAFPLLLGACMTLSGCGSTRIVQNSDTCGNELMDLQKALDSGAMTQHEYDKARSVAIERCNSRDNR